MNKPIIIWHRLDLRLADNPALLAACRLGRPIIPVFIWAPEEESPWEPGAASRWWLHQSLQSLGDGYRALGSRLLIRRGATLSTLRALLQETGADAVFWNRRYEPCVIARDAKVKCHLRNDAVEVKSFNAALLNEPWKIHNKSGRPFQVFTPFWKHCLSLEEPAGPLDAPNRLQPPIRWPKSLALEELELEPRIDWAGGLRSAWQPGEAGATENLKRFLKTAAKDYPTARDRPSVAGTSRLSPHLHFGEISPRQVWHAAKTAGVARDSRYLTELGWREFSHHLLCHFPNTPDEPLRPEFARFRWRKEPDWLNRWQKGLTGYPIVDAGMRELWTTGWMHNRVRMIVGSFLVKDLLISWNEGARWFWDTLVDADLAQNTLGWQWTAGCGADAAPYFRIFNPVTQGEKFDPHGEYVRRWCPELAAVPDRWIHQPWASGLKVNYPERVVSHAIAREVALEEFKRIKS